MKILSALILLSISTSALLLHAPIATSEENCISTTETLNENSDALSENLQRMPIEGVCVPKEWGVGVLLTDWHNPENNTKMMVFSFEQFEAGELAGKRANIIFADYDFEIGAAFNRYAQKRDFYSVNRRGITSTTPLRSTNDTWGKTLRKNESLISVSGYNSIHKILLKEIDYFGERVWSLHSQIIIPFEQDYLAFDFTLDTRVVSSEKDKSEFRNNYQKILSQQADDTTTQFISQIAAFQDSLSIPSAI